MLKKKKSLFSNLDPPFFDCLNFFFSQNVKSEDQEKGSQIFFYDLRFSLNALPTGMI